MTELQRQKRGFEYFLLQILEILSNALLSFLKQLSYFSILYTFGGKIISFNVFT